MFGKGITRDEEKRLKHAHKVAVIAAVRAVVVERDGGRCRICKKRVGEFGEMHEMAARSKTRGREPEERWNTRVCLLLCHQCHGDVTEHRVWLLAVDGAMGADGPVTVSAKKAGAGGR